MSEPSRKRPRKEEGALPLPSEPEPQPPPQQGKGKEKEQLHKSDTIEEEIMMFKENLTYQATEAFNHAYQAINTIDFLGSKDENIKTLGSQLNFILLSAYGSGYAVKDILSNIIVVHLERANIASLIKEIKLINKMVEEIIKLADRELLNDTKKEAAYITWLNTLNNINELIKHYYQFISIDWELTSSMNSIIKYVDYYIVIHYDINKTDVNAITLNDDQIRFVKESWTLDMMKESIKYMNQLKKEFNDLLRTFNKDLVISQTAESIKLKKDILTNVNRALFDEEINNASKYIDTISSTNKKDTAIGILINNINQISFINKDKWISSNYKDWAKIIKDFVLDIKRIEKSISAIEKPGDIDKELDIFIYILKDASEYYHSIYAKISIEQSDIGTIELNHVANILKTELDKYYIDNQSNRGINEGVIKAMKVSDLQNAGKKISELHNKLVNMYIKILGTISIVQIDREKWETMLIESIDQSIKNKNHVNNKIKSIVNSIDSYVSRFYDIRNKKIKVGVTKGWTSVTYKNSMKTISELIENLNKELKDISSISEFINELRDTIDEIWISISNISFKSHEQDKGNDELVILTQRIKNDINALTNKKINDLNTIIPWDTIIQYWKENNPQPKEWYINNIKRMKEQYKSLNDLIKRLNDRREYYLKWKTLLLETRFIINTRIITKDDGPSVTETYDDLLKFIKPFFVGDGQEKKSMNVDITPTTTTTTTTTSSTSTSISTTKTTSTEVTTQGNITVAIVNQNINEEKIKKWGINDFKDSINTINDYYNRFNRSWKMNIQQKKEFEKTGKSGIQAEIIIEKDKLYREYHDKLSNLLDDLPVSLEIKSNIRSRLYSNYDKRIDNIWKSVKTKEDITIKKGEVISTYDNFLRELNESLKNENEKIIKEFEDEKAKLKSIGTDAVFIRHHFPDIDLDESNVKSVDLIGTIITDIWSTIDKILMITDIVMINQSKPLFKQLISTHNELVLQVKGNKTKLGEIKGLYTGKKISNIRQFIPFIVRLWNIIKNSDYNKILTTYKNNNIVQIKSYRDLVLIDAFKKTSFYIGNQKNISDLIALDKDDVISNGYVKGIIQKIDLYTHGNTHDGILNAEQGELEKILKEFIKDLESFIKSHTEAVELIEKLQTAFDLFKQPISENSYNIENVKNIKDTLLRRRNK